ncbi:glutathione S-transferase [Dentipellis sp. KUC8613]|nr:glutathione S-transferase [Dentipellis sp. KUC8613]
MGTQELTFYTTRGSPFAERVDIAFEEVGVHPTRYSIDLRNKPEWFLSKVNPKGEVPAIAYGGPKVAPENPSPESVKLAESLVLLEFVSELYPNANLHPKDPVDRARARFFIDASTKITQFYSFILQPGTSPDEFIERLRSLQALLPPGGGWAVGPQFTIADAAFAPFLGRIELFLRNGVGRYDPAEGKRVYELLFKSTEFARLQQYWRDIAARPSFKASFDEADLLIYGREWIKKKTGENSSN